MSAEDIAQQVASLLKTDAEKFAEGAVDLRMKDLPGIVSKELEGLPAIVRKEMDACLDGKCDAIAERLVEKLPKSKASTLKVEDVTKAVKTALEEGKSPWTIEGHTAHDILDCPTCKPLIIDKLWDSEEYKQKVMEQICEDDACREAISKMFKDKGHGADKEQGVEEDDRKDESWAERRLRERRERASG